MPESQMTASSQRRKSGSFVAAMRVSGAGGSGSASADADATGSGSHRGHQACPTTPWTLESLRALHVTGMIIWTGQFCQGMVVDGATGCMTVERWQFDLQGKRRDGRGGGEWVRTFRSGDGAVPCGWIVQEARAWKVGGQVGMPCLTTSRRAQESNGTWWIVESDFEYDE